jgi:hypothetical protein
MRPQFLQMICLLLDGEVNVILIGGVAANAHGSARATFDIDFVYQRTRTNLERLSAALAPTQPYLRGAPTGLPFVWDVATIRNGLNFTLTTTLGDVDFLGEVAGGGNYEDLVPYTIAIQIEGRELPVVDLDKLIVLKRAAGRPKDLEAIAELEILRAGPKWRGPGLPPAQP